MTNPAVAGQHDVVGLEVAVNHAGDVDGADPGADAAGDRHRVAPPNAVECVFWDNRDGTCGWCAVKARDVERELSTETACGQFVTLPGRYRQRVPDCPDCRGLLIAALVSAQLLLATLPAPVSPEAALVNAGLIPVKRKARKGTGRTLSPAAQKRRKTKARKARG